MRKGWIIAIIIALLIIGILSGIYYYNNKQTQDSNTNNKQLAIENIINNEEKENIVFTSSTPKRVSPNASVLQKHYFIGCDHLNKSITDIPEELVNKTKEDVENYYIGWSVDSFSDDSIIIYKESEGFCNQHYLIKEHNGVLGIYILDEDGNATLKEDTEIQTMYLPEVDLEKVKQGIEAIGDMALYTVLEDFE